MIVMGVDCFECCLVAIATVLQPIANPSNRPAAQLGCSDNIRVLTTGLQHFGGFKPSAYLDNLFFGHHITQEVLHSTNVSNSSQGLSELPSLFIVPKRGRVISHMIYFIKVK